MPAFRPTSALALAALALAPAALAPTALAKPSLNATRAAAAQAISDCRRIGDREARLDCYDKAADAFDQAQAAGQVVVVDRAQMQQVKRQAFGFSMPSLNLFNHTVGRETREDRVDVIDVKLAGAHRDGEGKWVMVTDEDAVWRQIDTTELYNEPHAGDVLNVHRAALGSYFCRINRDASMRCTRER